MWFIFSFFSLLLMSILIKDADITMCGFKFSVTFYCDSHSCQLFPLVCACIRRARKRRFHGSVTACRTAWRYVRLPSARSPLHWECSRRDKRLPCEKPFMAHEVLTGFGCCWFCDCERHFRCWINYSGAESTKTVHIGWCAFFAQQSKAPGQTPHSVFPQRSI